VPETTGEDQARPWMGVCQVTFSVSFQTTGMRAASA
jgi:hypothetical protein